MVSKTLIPHIFFAVTDYSVLQIYYVCQGEGLEAKACKFRYLFIINESLVLLNLADTVVILINTTPSNVKDNSIRGAAEVVELFFCCVF